MMRPGTELHPGALKTFLIGLGLLVAGTLTYVVTVPSCSSLDGIAAYSQGHMCRDGLRPVSP